MVREKQRDQSRVDVTPEVIEWARVYRGLDISDAAEKLDISPETLLDIESGREAPIFPLLNKMRGVYKQSLGVLLRHTLPLTPPSLMDFRTIRGETPNLTPETLGHIREAQLVQDKLRELQAQAPELIPVSDIPAAEGFDDPETVAAHERTRFGVSIDAQKRAASIKSKDDAFHYWRSVFQERGILVFAKSLAVENCRGFSLWVEDGPPVIVVSSRDSAAGRIFTLMHEYAHLARRQSSMCIAGRERVGENVEPWCNSFAAAFLVPADDLGREISRRYPRIERDDWSMRQITALAAIYRISDLSMAIRLKTLGYSDLVDDARQDLLASDRKRSGGGGGNVPPETLRRPYRRAGEFGFLAVSAFVRASASGEMDPGRATHALRLKSVRELEDAGRHAELFRRERQFTK